MSMWKTGKDFSRLVSFFFSLSLESFSLFWVSLLSYKSRVCVGCWVGHVVNKTIDHSSNHLGVWFFPFHWEKGTRKKKEKIRRLRRQSLKSLTHTQLEGAWYSLLRVSDCASHLVSFSFIFRSLLFVVRCCCCCCEMSWNFKWVWATFLTRLNIDFIFPLTLTQQQQQ